MTKKELYTKIFIQQSGKAITEATIKEYTPVWWQNTRTKDTGGMRLTDEGLRFIIEDLALQTYDIPYPKDFEFTVHSIIFLDQFIDCPYYMGRKALIVTDEKKALELSLFSGDIRKYGLTKAMKRHDSESNQN